MPIVLMTDFGTEDCYAGILKGVIARIAPTVPVLDLSHGISPFHILQGAFTLAQAYRYFPEGSIFIAVVDPGVGSARKPILAKTPLYTFLAPDNGLLSMVLEREKEHTLFCLDNPRYHLPEVSGTFHARDIFAPVAAHLSLGTALSELGSPLERSVRLEECFPKKEKGKILGRILMIDRFGNGITNLDRETIEVNFPEGKWSLQLAGKSKPVFQNVSHHYVEGKPGQAMLLWGSSGFLEIACREGNAAKKFKLHSEQEVWVE